MSEKQKLIGIRVLKGSIYGIIDFDNLYYLSENGYESFKTYEECIDKYRLQTYFSLYKDIGNDQKLIDLVNLKFDLKNYNNLKISVSICIEKVTNIIDSINTKKIDESSYHENFISNKLVSMEHLIKYIQDLKMINESLLKFNKEKRQ